MSKVTGMKQLKSKAIKIVKIC